MLNITKCNRVKLIRPDCSLKRFFNSCLHSLVLVAYPDIWRRGMFSWTSAHFWNSAVIFFQLEVGSIRGTDHSIVCQLQK